MCGAQRRAIPRITRQLQRSLYRVVEMPPERDLEHKPLLAALIDETLSLCPGTVTTLLSRRKVGDVLTRTYSGSWANKHTVDSENANSQRRRPTDEIDRIIGTRQHETAGIRDGSRFELGLQLVGDHLSNQ